MPSTPAYPTAKNLSAPPGAQHIKFFLANPAVAIRATETVGLKINNQDFELIVDTVLGNRKGPIGMAIVQPGTEDDLHWEDIETIRKGKILVSRSWECTDEMFGRDPLLLRTVLEWDIQLAGLTVTRDLSPEESKRKPVALGVRAALDFASFAAVIDWKNALGLLDEPFRGWNYIMECNCNILIGVTLQHPMAELQKLASGKVETILDCNGPMIDQIRETCSEKCDDARLLKRFYGGDYEHGMNSLPPFLRWLSDGVRTHIFKALTRACEPAFADANEFEVDASFVPKNGLQWIAGNPHNPLTRNDQTLSSRKTMRIKLPFSESDDEGS